MPNIQSAKKKVKKDKKRQKQNSIYRTIIEKGLKKLLKLTEDKRLQSDVRTLVSKIDKAVKEKVFHKNKGARLKSRVMKLKSK